MRKLNQLYNAFKKLEFIKESVMIAQLNSFAGNFAGQCKIYNIQEHAFGLDIDMDGNLDDDENYKLLYS